MTKAEIAYALGVVKKKIEEYLAEAVSELAPFGAEDCCHAK